MRQLWKKTIAATLMVSLVLTIYGCGKRTDVRKYSSSFFDCFDTVITVYGYSSDQTSFNQMGEVKLGEFRERLPYSLYTL